MRQNANIIVDNTNKTIKTRQSLINAAREMGYNVIGIMMATPYEVCEKRAENENFPVETLVEAANKWENPTEDEGFDKIIVIDSEKYTSKDNQNNETL